MKIQLLSDLHLEAHPQFRATPAPGADVLVEKGQSGCQLRFSDFVGIDFRSSTLDFHFYYPTPSSWSQGDRTIYCMVVDPGLKVTGSLEGSKR